jgi:electron transfer flavoprotein beta subunit
MKIVVCIKQVPNTTDVRINPETNTLIREGVESIINPFDMYAIEEGIRLKEKHGGETIVLTMGAPMADSALREAISLGIDKAVLLTDRGFAGADTLATGFTLAAAIDQLDGADVILMGKQASDGDTGQVGPGVAQNLGIPHITDVRRIEEIADGKITVQRLLEDGYLRLRTNLPAVITVVKEINKPRLPSLRGITRSKSAVIPVWKAADLGVDKDMVGLSGSATKVIKIFFPKRESHGQVLSGPLESQVDSLLEKLRGCQAI